MVLFSNLGLEPEHLYLSSDTEVYSSMMIKLLYDTLLYAKFRIMSLLLPVSVDFWSRKFSMDGSIDFCGFLIKSTFYENSAPLSSYQCSVQVIASVVTATVVVCLLPALHKNWTIEGLDNQDKPKPPQH